MDPVNTYNYNTLEEEDFFRILELDQTDPAETQLSGRLIPSRLEDSPDYYAISYAWGDQQPTCFLYLKDGNYLRITRTLFDVIKAVSSAHTRIRLWADQICINQDDKAEKVLQLKLMGTIYRNARQVIGWLGNPTKDSAIGLKLLHFLSSKQDNSNTIQTFEELTTGVRFNPSDDPRKMVDLVWFDKIPHIEKLTERVHNKKLGLLLHPHSDPMKAAAAILQRPWFTRLWIIQEVLLSSRLKLLCGQHSISGDVFFAAIQFLGSMTVYPYNSDFVQRYRNAQRLTWLKDEIISKKFESTLYPSLAHIFSDWRCSKDEDRLNALFAIAFRDSPSACAWFTPSYSMCTPELYTSFTKAHVIKTQSLEILHFAGCGDSSTAIYGISQETLYVNMGYLAADIPSWAPDWRIESRPVPFTPLIHRGYSEGFSATISQPDFEFDEEGGILHIRARKVDRIVCCGYPVTDEVCVAYGAQDKIFHTWFDLATRAIPGNDTEAMFVSTLIVDGKIQPHYGTNYSVESRDNISAFRQWFRTSLSAEEPESLANEEYRGMPVDKLEGCAVYARWASEICRYRTFFVTEQGLCGLGSLHLRPGLSIYYIHGLKTPFVVQDALEKGRHHLHGECFVYGLMDRKVDWSEEDVYLSII